MVSVCLSVCFCYNHAKPTLQISMKFCTQMVYLPGSDIGLFPLPYLSSFQDDGFFSNVSTCQLGSFYFTLLYNKNAFVFPFN